MKGIKTTVIRKISDHRVVMSQLHNKQALNSPANSGQSHTPNSKDKTYPTDKSILEQDENQKNVDAKPSSVISLKGSEKQPNSIAVNTDPPEPVRSMNVLDMGKVDQAIVIRSDVQAEGTEYRNSEM